MSIQLQGISKAYGDQTLLHHVSLVIQKGEKCALLGRNGAGKSTLLRLIAEEEEVDAGTIQIPRGYRIGYLKQHLDVTESTLVDEAAKGLLPSQSDQRYRVEALLFGLGFSKEDLNRPPTVFSGGYRIRIHLCQMLAGEPDCLLLDEPSNYLDIVSLRWLVRFLKDWRGEILLISHDRDLLDSICTHTVGIHRQRLKKLDGGTEAYYSQILQEEEIHERTRLNLEKKRTHMQSFVDRFGAKSSKATQAQSRVKAINRLPVLEKLAQLHHLDFEFPYSPFPSQKVLETKGLDFRYPDQTEPLIHQFELLIEQGEKIAIVGKNGRGKSTLLQLLAGQLQPTQGTLRLSEKARIGYFGQTHVERLDLTKTIYAEIASANPQLNDTQIRAICGVMLFSGDTALKRISVLSGGERSRVLLGKILATPCNVLLLDEPTNHLDMESVEMLVDALEAFPGVVVLVTHCEWILRRLPTRLIICRHNRQRVFEGGYDDFLTKVGWEEESVKPAAAPPAPPPPKPRQPSAKPLKKKIELIEKAITDGSVQVEALTQLLTQASERGDLTEIARLGKEIAQLEERLSGLYEQHEALWTQSMDNG